MISCPFPHELLVLWTHQWTFQMLHARKIFPIDLRGWHWVVRRLVSEVVGRHLAILLADSNMCLPKSLAYCNGRLREDFQPSGLIGSAFGTYLQLASGWSFSMLRLCEFVKCTTNHGYGVGGFVCNCPFRSICFPCCALQCLHREHSPFKKHI